MRWSVGDPDRLFDRWTPRLRFFFSRPFLALSVALFVVYCVIAVAKWSDLSRGMAALYTPSTYTIGTVVLFWSALMVVVCVHELGHGFTCKYFGGQVHELGAMLIYFQPAFYCNVNDAWTFPDLRARLWVTAAGSWIQLVFAAYGTLALLYSTGLLLFLVAAIFGWVGRTGGTVGTLAFAVALGTMLRGRLRAAARSVAASLREHRAQWMSPPRRRWLAGGALAALLLGVVVPWPITVGGAFTAAAPLELDLKAPEGAVVVQARAAEGTRVAAGAPVLVFRDADLQRRAIGVRRLADSLAALEGAVAAAAAGQAGDGQLEARVLVPRTAGAWRAGATGEAKITLRRSNLIGALVWAVRKRVRSDLLL